MHARLCWVTDAPKGLTFFDGCAQRSFEARMRARVGVSPGCAQPAWRMRATPLTKVHLHSVTSNFFQNHWSWLQFFGVLVFTFKSSSLFSFLGFTIFSQQRDLQSARENEYSRLFPSLKCKPSAYFFTVWNTVTRLTIYFKSLSVFRF